MTHGAAFQRADQGGGCTPAGPELGRFAKRVEPAVVNARQVHRLRISGADAHALCATLKREGLACLVVE